MTRHLCAEDVLLAVDAAGADPIRSTVGMMTPTATAAASEALKRKLRRIGLVPFSPCGRGHRSVWPKTFPESLHSRNIFVKRDTCILCRPLQALPFRNVPEHAS